MNSGPNLERAPIVGIAINAGLAAVKIIAGVVGNSYALVADGIESTSDIVSSLVVWGGLRVASRPANERHPYGYGKAEALAALVTSAALIFAAVMIAIQSVREILTPHHLPHWSTLLVLVLVIVVKETLARWVSGMGKEAGSSALDADAWHHRSDALTSLAAFIGITIGLIGGKGYEPADDYAALAACFVILYSGLRLLVFAVGDLLDIAPPKEFETKVRSEALEIGGVLAVEKCRIRKSGTSYFVEIHIQVDGATSVEEAHQIGGRVRRRLRDSELRIADVHVHIEPFVSDSASETPRRH